MRAKCPKCHGKIVIPTPEQASNGAKATAPPVSESADSARERSDEDPFAQFTVYDVETELVYDTSPEDGLGRMAGPVDPNKVAVSRRVLYAQGILLGLVALGSFALGVFVGIDNTAKTSDADAVPQPCVLRGRVVVQNNGGEPTADIGAVAIVLPRDVRPEQKVDIAGLRPQDPPSEDEQGRLRSIRDIGGDYARTDEEGRFQLTVPDRGNYFLLVISASASSPEDDQPKTVLAQIGRFFQLTPNLFEGHAYRWQEETIRRNRELNIVFP